MENRILLFSVQEMIEIGRSQGGKFTPEEDMIVAADIKQIALYKQEHNLPTDETKDKLDRELAEEGVYYDRCRGMLRQGRGAECEKKVAELKRQKQLTAAITV